MNSTAISVYNITTSITLWRRFVTSSMQVAAVLGKYRRNCKLHKQLIKTFVMCVQGSDPDLL